MTQKAAIIGGGVIGGGWAARFLLNGWDVDVFDPDPDAARKIGAVLDNARRSLPALYDRALPAEGQWRVLTDMGAAIENAAWIQESVPGRLDLKHKVYTQITALAAPDAVIGSSTSGFKPSQLQAGLDTPGQILVAHPFNPVYLLPLVELVASDATTPATLAQAETILTSLGMKPLILRKEIDAHIADRLLESVWREALWLIKDGICTTEELDDAIRYGFGLRWAQMGLFETYRIAGGDAGMKHFLDQFGPCLAWPWTRLTDVPDYDDALVDLIAGQSDAQSGQMTIRQLEHLRDDNLVGIMRSLRKSGSGAGSAILAHEATLPMPPSPDLPITLHRQIPQTWTDYNGHMNEATYMEAASLATDGFMALIGCDADYIAKGGTYFTAESHVQFLNELHQGQMLTITTQVIVADGKKLHLFHYLRGPDDVLAATVETFLIHMDLTTRASSMPSPEVAAKMADYAAAHANLPAPEGLGRSVGQRSRKS